ncbi:SH3 domain-containing protein [Hoeflea poritis]|uniref:SH3 domain-containing protein n=1 Tax=Hoeflea poritis TaxID=2993659 RepID=A0ABT4VH50_9HYPH|nr:SH3 domain-containing protein [Hoeflea poritis]MDA4844032.1 SH3 domain-containing protein [Hoeflea poritis]
MIKRILTGLVAIVGASTITGAAQAATSSYTTANVNLRAGPGTSYPVVVTVPNGTPITTYGCLDGYNWCDVSWGTERGWMSASYIQITYQGQPRIITPAIAPAVGLTVVVYNRAYWDRYYYGRPWYRHWDRYYRPPPHAGKPPRAVQPLPPRPPKANPRPPQVVQPIQPRPPRATQPKPRRPQAVQPIQPRPPKAAQPSQPRRPQAVQPVQPRQPRATQPRMGQKRAIQPRQGQGQRRNRRG